MPGTRRIVVVVDDDSQVLTAIQRIVAVGGYHTLCYASAEDVLLDVAWISASIAILDYHLEGMDGVALGQAMQETAPGLKIIYITAGSLEGIPKPSLHKPDIYKQLLPLIGSLLANGGVH